MEIQQSPFRLDGRLSVVTGATRGIGAAYAAALAAAGADVVGVGSSDIGAHTAVRESVEAVGRRYEALVCDFADRAAVQRLAAELASRDIDILANNAGTVERAPAEFHALDAWDRVLEVDLSSHWVLTQVIGSSMLARGRGRIVFTASMLSFQGGLMVPGYAVAKSGIAGLVRALSNEWAARGVTVNGIAPGYVETAVTAALRADPERSRQILDRIPAGRWGTPEDVAGAIVFLASDAAEYVTGTILTVDGGWLGR